jgi:hypothetical protein
MYPYLVIEKNHESSNRIAGQRTELTISRLRSSAVSCYTVTCGLNVLCVTYCGYKHIAGRYDWQDVVFDVLTAVVMEVAIFWDTGRLDSMWTKFRKNATPATRCFLVRVIFNHDDGCEMFLRNVGSYKGWTALHPRRWQLSWLTGVMFTAIQLTKS